jgi:hypothetical protein
MGQEGLIFNSKFVLLLIRQGVDGATYSEPCSTRIKDGCEHRIKMIDDGYFPECGCCLEASLGSVRFVGLGENGGMTLTEYETQCEGRASFQTTTMKAKDGRQITMTVEGGEKGGLVTTRVSNMAGEQNRFHNLPTIDRGELKAREGESFGEFRNRQN